MEVPRGARPTSGRAREALFDILGERIPGCRILDLYAGSGAVGLEAVSRGAARAVLVERDSRAIERNLGALRAGKREVELRAQEAGDVVSTLARRGERFDLVFCDPPYGGGKDALPPSLAALLAPRGLLVVQTDSGEPPPELPGLALLRRRPYGRNVFSFFEAVSSAR